MASIAKETVTESASRLDRSQYDRSSVVRTLGLLSGWISDAPLVSSPLDLSFAISSAMKKEYNLVRQDNSSAQDKLRFDVT